MHSHNVVGNFAVLLNVHQIQDDEEQIETGQQGILEEEKLL